MKPCPHAVSERRHASEEGKVAAAMRALRLRLLNSSMICETRGNLTPAASCTVRRVAIGRSRLVMAEELFGPAATGQVEA